MSDLLLQTTVNGEEKGDLSAIYAEGHYWLQADALRIAGIQNLQGESREFNGTSYLRIDRIERIQGFVNEAEMQLILIARAEDLGEHTIELYQQHSKPYPDFTGLTGYLDYSISAYSLSSSEIGYGFAPTINLSNGPWNFRSSFDYQSSSREKQWLRLYSTLTHDDPQQMSRLTIGDLTSGNGNLGRCRSMAGIGYSRIFALQPDFNSSPSFQATTAITTTSTAEVYLNGQRVKTVDLAPGMYNFSDLRYFSGMQDVTLIIRDAFGRSQTLSVPYYFDDSMLKAGLQEFNYNIGIARAESSFDHYAGLAYSAYHRIGLTDWFTAGYEASSGNGNQSSSLFATLRLGNYGILGGASGRSKHDDNSRGHGSRINYSYQNQQLAIQASLQRQSSNYWLNNAQLTNGSQQPDWASNIGISYGNRQIGNWNLNVGRQSGAGSDSTFNGYRIGYSVTPMKQVTISSNISVRDYGDKRCWGAFINLSWYFGKHFNLYTSTQHDAAGKSYSSSIANTPSSGEGLAYNLNAQNNRNGNEYSAWFEHRARHGTANLSYYQSKYEANSTSSWRFSLAGSLAFDQAHFAITRPIGQSFAVVDTAGLSDVGVYQNGEEVARSNQSGIAFIPRLSSYSHHQLSLRQDDIPLDFSVEQLSHEILTGNNNGQQLRFDLRQISALSALIVNPDGTPLSNQVVKLKNNDLKLQGATTLNGLLYIEGLKQGNYELNSTGCTAHFEVPKNRDVVFDVGKLVCRPIQGENKP